LLPNAGVKIGRIRAKLKLNFEKENIFELISEKKRFYRLIAKNESGQPVFLKAAMADDRTVLGQLVNEINFHLVLKKSLAHPLNRYVPRILDFSLNPDFPFFLREAALESQRKSENDFSSMEIKKVAHLLDVVRTSPTNIFSFAPKINMFSFSFLAEKIKSSASLFDQKLFHETQTFLEKTRKMFSSTKAALSHGDTSETNLVFSKSGTIKIIDWNDVYLRNPLFDFAEFWIKRRRKPSEQDLLLKETSQKFEPRFFSFLFSSALVEITLRDLNLFSKMLERYRLEKRADRIKHVEREKKEYLLILKKAVK